VKQEAHNDWKVVRITLHPKYYRAGIYPAIQRSVLAQIKRCQSLEQSLQQGYLQEVHPARGAKPVRRFLIYLSDAKYGTEIPVSFSLSLNGALL
jgi:hypothetical protein